MKKNLIPSHSALFCKILILYSAASTLHVNATELADIPMAVNNLARPNLMFMIDDSGSMDHIVPNSTSDTPAYNSSTQYLNCTNPYDGGAATVVGAKNTALAEYGLRITKSNGNVEVWRDSGSDTYAAFGNTSSNKCFSDSLYYRLKSLNASSCDATYCSSITDAGSTIIPGRFLNWYFGSSSDYSTPANFGASATRKPGTKTRLEVAQAVAKSVISGLDKVRVGLFGYNGGSGGNLLQVMGDLDTAKRTAMNTAIDAITGNGYTPLAETLSDMGRYFTTGYSGNLTLHPGGTSSTESIGTFFNSHNYNNLSGVATPSAPIQYWCQRSFAILMTDGLPTEDRSISSSMKEYYGYCTSASTSSNCLSPISSNYGMRSKMVNVDTGAVTTSDEYYDPTSASDYLDDVANSLYDIDLRPDLVPPSGTKTNKNNLYSYAISFADPMLSYTTLLERAAKYSGGKYAMASNSSELTAAFNAATDDILSKDGSAAAVAVANANVTSGDNASYVSSYNSGTWTGDLIAYPINITTGQPDINSPIWNSGCADTAAWVDPDDHSKGKKSCSAQVKLDSTSYTTRKIVTLKDESSTRTPVQFQPTTATTTTKLSTTQQTMLNSTTSPPGLTDGADVAKFLRGDTSLAGTSYRTRTHILGDLVNSEPTVQREPFYSYADGCYSAPVTTGAPSSQCATSFKSAKSTRTRMVYIGGNDGLLHAFNASNGVEEWAYVPRFTMANLNNLSKKSGFTHKYSVDGTAVIGDVDFGNTDGGSGQDWRTILVGGLGKGGRGFYALDVTCPVGTTTATATACGTTLTEANLTAKVLWEFPSSDTTHSSHLLNVGYSFGKPIITKTAAYGWVVLVTSGYNNGTGTDNSGGNGHGYLYVLNAKTGAVIKAIDTGVGTTTDPSGLAHIAAYVTNADIDNTAEYAYGGDLKGNLWRFDLTDNSGSIVYTVTKVATLKDAGGTEQPITTVPELATISIGGADKHFVYVGTGQYLGNADVATSQTQTMYGLIDDLTITTSPVIANPVRSALQQQTLTTSGTTRTLTTNTPDWTTKKGWYVDLPGCDVGSCTSGSERITGDPVLALGALIFTSNIPSSVSCTPGGSSWLNVVDYKTGGKLTDSTVAWSSQFMGNALSSRAVVIKLPSGVVKTLTRLSDATTNTTEVPVPTSSTGTNRISWREIIEQ